MFLSRLARSEKIRSVQAWRGRSNLLTRTTLFEGNTSWKDCSTRKRCNFAREQVLHVLVLGAKRAYMYRLNHRSMMANERAYVRAIENLLQIYVPQSLLNSGLTTTSSSLPCEADDTKLVRYDHHARKLDTSTKFSHTHQSHLWKSL
jgi:hypothetical protein